MALTIHTVSQIILVVSQDPLSRSRINSSLRGGGASSFGIAGAIRNYSIAFAYTFTPSGLDKEFDPGEISSMAYKYSCDGIAEATVKAIKAKIAEIPALGDVSDQARVKGYSHTGTLLTMKDGTKYVLDWWRSLDAKMPFVFKYNDFIYNRTNGIRSLEFKGFSD